MRSWFNKFAALILAPTFAVGLSASTAIAQDELPKLHAIHMFDGEPEYAADFQHWNYVNPDAPRGGEVVLGTRFSFDTLNHMNGKGLPATQLREVMYNSLLTSNGDEVDTRYGELAEWMQMPTDRSSITFKIRDEAKWADGVAVTPADVVFTWAKQREQGFEGFGSVYTDVLNIEDIGENRVKFTFNKEAKNRELPFTVGSEEIIPMHYWKDRDFSKTTQEVPLTSGPYAIADFELGQFIKYELRDDYWAMDLPQSATMFIVKCRLCEMPLKRASWISVLKILPSLGRPNMKI